jgi:hypothetical protein
MICRTWSQPDANHTRGLCTNTLFSEGHNNTCVICADPIGLISTDCGVFSFMKKSPTDIVVIPRIWTLTFEPAIFTMARTHVCHLAAPAGTMTETFLPELIGTSITMSSGPHPTLREWVSPQLAVGSRSVSYRFENYATGDVSSEMLVWDLTAQFTFTANLSPGNCSFNGFIRLRRQIRPDLSTVSSHGGALDPNRPQFHPCASTYIGAFLHPFGGGGFQDLPMVLLMKSSVTAPLFVEYNGDLNTHSPWRLRFGMVSCAQAVSWGHSGSIRAYSDGSGSLEPCVAADYRESWVPSNGLNSPATSPMWHPHAMSFRVTE